MTPIEIIAQLFGILGFIFSVISYQSKKNKGFFIMQGAAGLTFFVNYLLIATLL